jgi:tRNA(fMet)-specific endonuclease VapC
VTRFLLDTNTISHVARNRSADARRLFKEAARELTVSISVISEAEILHGFAKRPGHHAFQAMRDILDQIPIIPWTSDTASVYGQLRARNQAEGISVGPLDMLIAAHALAINATLVTSDRALRGISGGPSVVDWASDI